MKTLKEYVDLALEGASYAKLAEATGFSSRQLWNMAGGGSAPALRHEGANLPPSQDDRYARLAAAIAPEHRVDPEDVRRAAQASYDRARTRERPTGSTPYDLFAQEVMKDPELRHTYIAVQPVVSLARGGAVALERRCPPASASSIRMFVPSAPQNALEEQICRLVDRVAEDERLDHEERMAVARLLRAAAMDGPEGLASLIHAAASASELEQAK